MRFAGLLACELCGCSITAELKKGRYIYYHCTGSRGRCGNTYLREEGLAQLLGEIVRCVEIPPSTANWIAEALRQSQADKKHFHQTAILKLQQRHLCVQAKPDRAYDDRLAGKISDELWSRRTQAWEAELELVRREVEQHETASHHTLTRRPDQRS